MKLGDRMKAYENAYKIVLPARLPVILRVDGRAFKHFTRNCVKPIDPDVVDAMQEVGTWLFEEISGVKVCYGQSDEVSALITNDDTLETRPWVGNKLQKLVSLAASIATDTFNSEFGDGAHVHFDARAFVLPPAEVINYFIWRQRDAVRNGVHSLARTKYSQKEINGLNTSQLIEKLTADPELTETLNNLTSSSDSVPLSPYSVRGWVTYKGVDEMIWSDGVLPDFSENRNFLVDLIGHEDIS